MDTVLETHRMIDKFHDVAAVAARVTLTDLMAGNFAHGTTFGDRLDLHDNVIRVLQSSRFPASVVRDADSAWSKGIGVIYHQIIQRYLEAQRQPNNRSDTPKDVLAALGQFRRMLDLSDWVAPSPDEMESFITQKGLMDDEVREWISDYRYFQNTTGIRRREAFVAQWENKL